MGVFKNKIHICILEVYKPGQHGCSLRHLPHKNKEMEKENAVRTVCRWENGRYLEPPPVKQAREIKNLQTTDDHKGGSCYFSSRPGLVFLMRLLGAREYFKANLPPEIL